MHILLLLVVVGRFYHTLLLATWIPTTSEASPGVYESLHNNLMDDYRKDLAPFYYSKGDAVKVIVIIQSAMFIDIDQIKEQVSVAVSVRFNWQDPRLEWEPGEYDGIESIRIPRSSIWLPEISVCNAVDRRSLDEDRTLTVKVNSTGEVSAVVNWVMFHREKMEVGGFPFGIQSISFCFLGRGRPDEVIYQALPLSGPICPPLPSEWKCVLDNMTVEIVAGMYTEGDASMILFTISGGRRPQFYIYLIMMPAFFIGFFILMGLFLDETGPALLSKSVNLALVGFTALAIISGTLSTTIPRTVKLPVMGIFMIAQVGLISVAVIVVNLPACFKRPEKIRSLLEHIKPERLRQAEFVVFEMAHFSLLVFVIVKFAQHEAILDA